MRADRWQEGTGDRETLAVALRAVLAHHAIDCTTAEIAAMLGCGAAVTAAPADPPEAWEQLARDQSIVPAATSFGLQLRALHPLAAAAGLNQSAEFPAHFRDSYVPLIRRAVEHGQPVLAWRGWPAPADQCWGVVLESRAEGLFGLTRRPNSAPGAVEQLVPLGAAHQVYVVEEADARHTRPAPGERVLAAAQNSVRMWNGAAAPEGVLCGAAAWNEIAARLASARPEESPRWVEVLRTIFAARRSLAGWLGSLSPRAFPPLTSELAAWKARAERVCGLLAGDATDPHAALRERVAGPRDPLCAALRAAADEEDSQYARLAEAIAPFARP